MSESDPRMPLAEHQITPLSFEPCRDTKLQSHSYLHYSSWKGLSLTLHFILLQLCSSAERERERLGCSQCLWSSLAMDSHTKFLVSHLFEKKVSKLTCSVWGSNLVVLVNLWRSAYILGQCIIRLYPTQNFAWLVSLNKTQACCIWHLLQHECDSVPPESQILAYMWRTAAARRQEGWYYYQECRECWRSSCHRAAPC